MKEKILTKIGKYNLHLLRWFVAMFLIAVMAHQSVAQSSVSGKVVAVTDNQGLPGVSVLIKGTSTGTSTDVNGNYTLSAASTDILVFSFVGFETVEIPVLTQSVIDLVMEEDIAALEEIIVTGYSQKSQKELSAAVVSLGVEDITNVTASSVESMLQGKVAGLAVNSPSGQPGEAPQLRLRGITSINADRPPLIVVDGMIGGNYVPSDVETITVLKDAAAIGLYGSLGAAGVLIVTTKQAKSGQTEIQFAATVGLKQASTGKFEMMNGPEIYDTQKKMWGPDNLINFLSNRPEEIRELDFNWLDAGFDQAIIQNYNFAARGSEDKLSYSFNVDYFDEEGTFKNTDFQRLNLRAGANYNSGKVFSIISDVNVQFNQGLFNHYSWFEDAFYSLPWDNPYYEDGSTKFVNSQEFASSGEPWYGQFRRNFVNSTGYNDIKSRGLDVTWSTRLIFKITDWLTIENRTRISGSSNRSDEFYSANTHEGIANNGILNSSTFNSRGILNTILLRMNKSYGDHDLSGFLGQEGSSSFFQTLGTEVQNLAPSTKVPSGGSVYSQVNGYDQSNTAISFMGEFNYGFRSKYFATVVYRIDGSSVFAKNKRYGSFPSASVAWLLSEEAFLSNSPTIDLLKLRLSYGLVGNDGSSGLTPFAFLPTYDITRQYNGQPGGDPDNPANDDLGWETSTITNLGVDFGVLRGDLVFNVDVYQKKVDGMLFLNPLALSQGYQARWENIGSMRNNGVEFSVNYAKSWKKWSYSGNFNVAYNDNQVTYISDITDTGFQSSGEVQQINRVGLEAFTWFMPRWVGVDPDNGNPIWERVEADGSISNTSDYNEATNQALSSALPKITGGISNSISYSNLTLSFLFTWQTGNDIYNQTREFVDSDGANTGINMMRLAEGWSRWEKPGDVATHTKLTRGDDDGSHFTSSRYLEKGDFLRFRNVSLTYNLPKSILKSGKIKNISITASADNLFTLTEFSGMDPDISMSVGAFELPGMSFLKYPISKQYLLKLNFTF